MSTKQIHFSGFIIFKRLDIMKSINIYSLILFLFTTSLFLTSCEDKIDVDLDDADPIIVIDAFITDVPGAQQEIIINRTQSYFDSSNPTPISNANVAIAVGGDALIGFDYEDGKYIWQPADGTSIVDFADDYQLIITIDGVEYTSSTIKGRSPIIEEIRQEIRENEIGSIDGGTYCEFIARDFEGIGDTYWIKTFKNGEFLNRPEEINIAYDAGFDQGAEADGLIFIPPIRELTNPYPDSTEVADEISPWTTGDICRVEIHSISNSTFGFMEIVRDQLINGNNGIFAEPLANAPGNIIASDGSDVLGAFNVAAVSSLEIIVE